MGFRNSTAFAVIIIMSLLAGCGGASAPDGYTKIVFETKKQPAPSNLMEDLMDLGEGISEIFTVPGSELMIFAISSTNPNVSLGRRYFSNVANALAGNWIIPNGSYIFSIVGYNTAAMVGPSLCDRANSGAPITLNGGTQTVAFTPTGGVCGNPPFNLAPQQAAGAYTNWQIHFCANNIAGAVATTASCGTIGGGSASPVNAINSLRVTYTAMDMFGYPPTNFVQGITSNCISVTPGGAGAFSATANIPVATATNPVLGDTTTANQNSFRPEMHILVFSGGGCSGAVTGGTDYAFPKGLGNAPTDTLLDTVGSTGIWATDPATPVLWLLHP